MNKNPTPAPTVQTPAPTKKISAKIKKNGHYDKLQG